MEDLIRVAAIDLGTVTARVGIADLRDGELEAIERKSAICNLGEGVDATGQLSQAAVDRVLAAVDDFLQQIKEAHCHYVGCFLTSAARDAQNSETLLEALRSRGLDPEVLAGEAEGPLTFLGVTQAIDLPSMAVADLGGGSTELTLGGVTDEGVAVDWTHSFDMGARRVTERYLERTDPPTREAIVQCCCEARMAFEAQMPWMDGILPRPDALVVTGGTATTAVAAKLGLDPYDSAQVQGATLTIGEVDEFAQLLSAMTQGQRAKVVGVQPQRAPVILGGVLLLGELMRAAGFLEVTVSESDGLAGECVAIAQELAHKKTDLPVKVSVTDLWA